MTQYPTGVLSLELVGGSLCLDFTNTVHNYEDEVPRDELQSYADLVRWSRRLELLDEGDAERLLALAEAHPRRAASVLDEARSLRCVVFNIFTAVDSGSEPEAEDLELLGKAYAEAMRHGQIKKSGERYAWSWDSRHSEMSQMLWPIVRSAVELLTSEQAGRIRQCESDRCTWLFIDKSKNHSRRWCEMSSCGNREKSRRHYHRAHGGHH